MNFEISTVLFSRCSFVLGLLAGEQSFFLRCFADRLFIGDLVKFWMSSSMYFAEF